MATITPDWMRGNSQNQSIDELRDPYDYERLVNWTLGTFTAGFLRQRSDRAIATNDGGRQPRRYFFLMNVIAVFCPPTNILLGSTVNPTSGKYGLSPFLIVN